MPTPEEQEIAERIAQLVEGLDPYEGVGYYSHQIREAFGLPEYEDEDD